MNPVLMNRYKKKNTIKMKYKITVQINKRKVIAMFNIIVVLIAIFYLFIFVRNQTISDITSKKENETIETI